VIHDHSSCVSGSDGGNADRRLGRLQLARRQEFQQPVRTRIYGVTADISIGRLFVAGVVPGLLMGISLMVMVAFVARREGMARQAFAGFSNIAITFGRTFFALMTPVLLLGGMFSGYFTSTEAAAVARLPIEATTFDRSLIVFDAIVKPETTPLLALAERSGCVTLRGREMMRGQISRMTDYFGLPTGNST